VFNNFVIVTGFSDFFGGGGEEMKTYKEYKADARRAALDWQAAAGTVPLSWFDLMQAGEQFERLARRYGLIKEFKENGII